MKRKGGWSKWCGIIFEYFRDRWLVHGVCVSGIFFQNPICGRNVRPREPEGKGKGTSRFTSCPLDFVVECVT